MRKNGREKEKRESQRNKNVNISKERVFRAFFSVVRQIPG
jgi:hypothetical protein